jgi:hypothetical protein
LLSINETAPGLSLAALFTYLFYSGADTRLIASIPLILFVNQLSNIFYSEADTRLLASNFLIQYVYQPSNLFYLGADTRLQASIPLILYVISFMIYFIQELISDW